MAFPFNNQTPPPFWGFGQHRNGEGVDHHTPPPFWGSTPPTPYPPGSSVPFGPGFPFLFAGPRGFGYVPGPHQEAFGHGVFGGDRGHHHSHSWRGRRGHGRGGHHGEQRQEGDEEHERENERGSRSRSRSPRRESDPLLGEQSAGNENELPREGPRHGPHSFHGRRGRGGFHHGRAWPRGGFGGFSRFGSTGAQVPPSYPPFDFSGLAAALQDHPWAQSFREYFRNAGVNLYGQNTGAATREAPDAAGDNETSGLDEDTDQSFTPPVDIFTTSSSYVLHVSLPGAKKEDVGINWDADSGELNIAGVIYRNGDEEFLNNIVQSERKIGMFERIIKLPPPGVISEEKEEVDSDHIVAKLEDGILVVTVPKVEREWTEVKKVDIL